MGLVERGMGEGGVKYGKGCLVGFGGGGPQWTFMKTIVAHGKINKNNKPKI